MWAFSWHRSYSPLHSTSLHPFPLLHLHLFSLIYPSILFRPSVAAAPLSLSITPAVMRLNLSVSTRHAHTLNAHTLQSAAAHTHTIIHLRERTILLHALNQHKPDTTMQLAHLALLPTSLSHTQTHLACDQGLSLLVFPSVSCYQEAHGKDYSNPRSVLIGELPTEPSGPQ